MSRVLVVVVLLSLLMFTSCDSLLQISPELNETFKDFSKIDITNDSLQTNVTNISIVKEAYIPINKTIKIASFNVQVFGQAKVNNKYVVDSLGNIISDYDLIAFQEIRDRSETAFPQLMEKELSSYRYIVSERLGRSTSKESYAYIYNPSKISLSNANVYPDQLDFFERPPYAVFVTAYSFDFVAIQIHTKPTDATEEIKHLRDVVEWAKKEYNENNILILGDLNADCLYYTEGTALQDYDWLISDDVDTTVSSNVCAYDRFITTTGWNKNVDVKCDVDNYEDDNITDIDLIKAISDHYPIECMVKI